MSAFICSDKHFSVIAYHVGNITDIDPQGVIIALYAKGQAKHNKTGFVVDVE